MTAGEPLLTTGEIAGIVVGGVVFILLLVLLIYFCTCNVKRYRQKKLAVASWHTNSRYQQQFHSANVSTTCIVCYAKQKDITCSLEMFVYSSISTWTGPFALHLSLHQM